MSTTTEKADEFEKAKASARAAQDKAAAEAAKREHEETLERVKTQNRVAAEANLQRLAQSNPIVAELLAERDALKAKLAELTAGSEDDPNLNPDPGADTGGKRRPQKPRA